MIQDSALAQLAADSYDATPTFAVGDVHVCVSEIEGVTVLAFRGTVRDSIEDWWRDFSSWPVVSRTHPTLGQCHDGFLTGAESVWSFVAPFAATQPTIIVGHSLGGAMAIIAAGLAISVGYLPPAVVTFGAPRAGEAPLVSILSLAAVRQYRNGNDLVPDVPPFFDHVRPPLIQVGVGTDNPLADHNHVTYVAAVKAHEAAVA